MMSTTRKHWVFDLDGTLVDSFGHYFASLEEIFEREGKKFTQELRYPALTESLDLFFSEHLGPSRVSNAFALLRQRSHEDALKIQVFSNLKSGLEQLALQGARMAVWTNRDLSSASLILKQTGLDQWVETCVSGTCIELKKPHPDGLHRILDRLGCGPEQVTMVGDHEHDVLGAKKAGVRAVRASWHAYFKIEACPWADAQFYQVDEFLSWAGV